ncbi:GT1 domain-containing protein isoform X1 [Xyrauchen texanus]|uniref:GT1 domain-containing protein isoform X1 n=1 Tax=Xyrauchen texanus TaxID=154827 RepID=UPI002241C526|nr:GT1 domain-containing protein isoform X1 [Xyrauchen texanus]
MMAKQRAAYFSTAELQLIMEGYDEVRHLIKTKGNTVAAAKVRQDAWRKIAAKLNASNPMGPKRTWLQVKVKYKNILQGVNKRRAAMKKTEKIILPTKEEDTPVEELVPESDVEGPVIKSIVGSCCSDPGDVACCSTYVKVTEHGLTLLQPPILSEEEEDSEPVEDVKTLYKKYLQAEISNRRQEMAYRALKMRKVEKEIELLDKKLAVSVTF